MKKFSIKKISILALILLLLTLTISGCKGIGNKERGITDTEEKSKLSNEEIEAIREEFDIYCENLAKNIIEESPLNATFMYGDLESLGLEDLLYQLDDVSEEKFREEIDNANEVLNFLESIDKEYLTNEQQITYEMLNFNNKAIIDGEKFAYYYNAFQPSSGVQINIPIALMQIELESEKEVKAYLERIKQIPRVFEQYIEYEHKRAQEGLLLPKNIYEIIIEQINNILVEPKSFMMYLSFCDRVDVLEGIEEENRSEYKAIMLDIIENEIYPAYEKMKDELSKIRDITTNTKGLSEWKKGQEYYDYLVRYSTSYDMNTNDLRKWAEIQLSAASMQIQTYMSKHPEIAESGDISGLLPNVESMKDLISIEEKYLSEAFKEYNIKKASENIIPEYLEEHLPPAFYFPISIDGEDYGNMYMTKEALSNISMETLETDIHENIPGHHLYFSVFYGSELPLIRKVYDFAAYTEGWAQYVQGKTYEYSAEDQEIGNFWKNLIKMNSAYQVLTDIQVNYDGISKEDAINILINMGYDQDSANTSYNRMIANPGEMINYYYGAYKIEGYLERYKKQKGNDFDIKEFHDIILKNGGLPFNIMDNVIKKY